MKKIFNYLAVILLLVGSFTACDNNDEVYEPGKTYDVTLDINSIKGAIEVLLDGEVLTPENTKKWGINVNPTKVTTDASGTPFLAYKGDRKLELRAAGTTEILWDTIMVPGMDYDITKYWNGEVVTDEIVLPQPAEGNIGFMFQINLPITGYTDPMDIEVCYCLRAGSQIQEMSEPLAFIEDYIPGSGYTPFIELRKMVDEPTDPNVPNQQRKNEFIFLRLKKANSDERYYNYATCLNNTVVGYHYDVITENWLSSSTYQSTFDDANSNAAMITIEENRLSQTNVLPGRDGDLSFRVTRIFTPPVTE